MLPQPAPSAWRTLAAGFGLGSLVLVAYAALLTEVFGASDDYTFFQLHHFLEGQPIPALDNGRPLLWPSFDQVAGGADSFTVMWRFRVIFLSGVTVAAVALFALLLQLWGKRSLAALAAALTFLAPPWVDACSTGANSWMTWVAVATIAAYACHLRALAVLPARPRALAWWTAALVLLVTGAAMHQSPLFLWIAFALARALLPWRSARAAVRSALADAGCFAAALSLHLCTAWLALAAATGIELTNRGSLTHEPLQKLAWFVALPLRDALVLPFIVDHDVFFDPLTQQPRHDISAALLGDVLRDPAYWAAGGVFLFVVTGLYLHLAKHTTQPKRLLLATLAALPISLTLNIVITSRWAPFRTQAGLVGVVAVLFTIAVFSLRDRGFLSRRATVAGAIASIAIAATVTAWNVQAYVVRPLACDWRTVLAEVERTHAADSLSVVPALPGESAAPGVRYELGRAASNPTWARAAMVWVARRELGHNQPSHVQILPPGSAGAVPQDGGQLISLRCREDALLASTSP